MASEERKNNLYCFGGEDATLKYYFRCGDCGTIVLQDDSLPQCMEPYSCPTCSPSEDFPFRYFTPEELKKDELLGKLVGNCATLPLLRYIREIDEKKKLYRSLIMVLESKIAST